MKTEGRRRSSNIEYGRNPGGSGGFGFGGGGRNNGLLILFLARLIGPLFRSRGGRIVLLVLLAGGLFFAAEGGLFSTSPQNRVPAANTPSQSASIKEGSFDRIHDGEQFDLANEAQLRDFMAVVLAETEDAWSEIFAEENLRYEPTTLVFFKDRVQSGCGIASSSTGPFYCPADHKVYLDVSFFRELGHQLGAHGDFAAAYVLAHEVGHHVQNLLGVHDSYVQRIQEGEAQKPLSVRLELQADYLAGVWAHYADKQGLLVSGDIEEALRATKAIGDDRLQKMSQGFVRPDMFTHGTSEQRNIWFRKGYEAGDLSAWDTFSLPESELG